MPCIQYKKRYQQVMKEGFNRRGTAPQKTAAANKMNKQLKQNMMQQKKVYCLTYRKYPLPPIILIHWCK
jgi:hypothetical protein